MGRIIMNEYCDNIVTMILSQISPCVSFIDVYLQHIYALTSLIPWVHGYLNLIISFNVDRGMFHICNNEY